MLINTLFINKTSPNQPTTDSKSMELGNFSYLFKNIIKISGSKSSDAVQLENNLVKSDAEASPKIPLIVNILLNEENKQSVQFNVKKFILSTLGLDTQKSTESADSSSEENINLDNQKPLILTKDHLISELSSTIEQLLITPDKTRPEIEIQIAATESSELKSESKINISDLQKLINEQPKSEKGVIFVLKNDSRELILNLGFNQQHLDNVLTTQTEVVNNKISNSAKILENNSSDSNAIKTNMHGEDVKEYSKTHGLTSRFYPSETKLGDSIALNLGLHKIHREPTKYTESLENQEAAANKEVNSPSTSERRNILTTKSSNYSQTPNLKVSNISNSELPQVGNDNSNNIRSTSDITPSKISDLKTLNSKTRYQTEIPINSKYNYKKNNGDESQRISQEKAVNNKIKSHEVTGSAELLENKNIKTKEYKTKGTSTTSPSHSTLSKNENVTKSSNTKIQAEKKQVIENQKAFKELEHKAGLKELTFSSARQTKNVAAVSPSIKKDDAVKYNLEKPQKTISEHKNIFDAVGRKLNKLQSDIQVNKKINPSDNAVINKVKTPLVNKILFQESKNESGLKSLNLKPFVSSDTDNPIDSKPQNISENNDPGVRLKQDASTVVSNKKASAYVIEKNSKEVQPDNNSTRYSDTKKRIIQEKTGEIFQRKIISLENAVQHSYDERASDLKSDKRIIEATTRIEQDSGSTISSKKAFTEPLQTKVNTVFEPAENISKIEQSTSKSNNSDSENPLYKTSAKINELNTKSSFNKNSHQSDSGNQILINENDSPKSNDGRNLIQKEKLHEMPQILNEELRQNGEVKTKDFERSSQKATDVNHETGRVKPTIMNSNTKSFSENEKQVESLLNPKVQSPNKDSEHNELKNIADFSSDKLQHEERIVEKLNISADRVTNNNNHLERNFDNPKENNDYKDNSNRTIEPIENTQTIKTSNDHLKPINSNVEKLPSSEITSEKVKVIQTNEILKEVYRVIESSEKQTAVLRLIPKELGSIKVILDTAENALVAKIEVQNENVGAAVRSGVEQLKQSLAQNGVTLSSISITFTSSENKQSNNFASKKKSNSSNKNIFEKIDDKQLSRTLGYNTYEYVA